MSRLLNEEVLRQEVVEVIAAEIPVEEDTVEEVSIGPLTVDLTRQILIQPKDHLCIPARRSSSSC